MAVSTIIIIGIAALALLWLWWQVPKWQLNSLKPKIPANNPKERADIEDNFRKTLSQTFGGAALLIGAGFAFFQFREQQSQFEQQQEAAQKQFREQQSGAALPQRREVES
jgi:hypothetical protein